MQVTPAPVEQVSDRAGLQIRIIIIYILDPCLRTLQLEMSMCGIDVEAMPPGDRGVHEDAVERFGVLAAPRVTRGTPDSMPSGC